MSALERLRQALEQHGCKPTSRGAARCPAHDDHSPSLSFGAARDFGGAVVKCHLGCSVADVLGALDLSTRDLFDEPKAKANGWTVTAEYTYTDEHGEVLFLKERRFPKDFRCKLPGGAYRLGDVRRVLYRLPDVLAAIDAGEPVYVVEGEKDADALAALGYAATCNFEGAAQEGQTPKWRAEYADVLKGADVVVVADRDGPGYAHAREVERSLWRIANSVQIVQAAVGKDVSDHLAAGKGVDELLPVEDDAEPPAAEPGVAGTGLRKITLTAASTIRVRPVRWLWTGRMPLGSLTLLAGREGIGKSTVAYTLAADLTRGRLPGQYQGQPRSVLVAATEDSWEHTIVPRLMAAGADLERVYRVDVTTSDGLHGTLSLPRDLIAVEHAVRNVDAALILLDPLMSRLDGKLDTHKDAEVRIALEPLTAVADRTGAAILGLIHVNKGQSTDPLNMVMASKAFTAVARAVLFVMVDPETDGQRLLGTPKNNLGRDDLPTLTFQIESAHVADTDEGAVWTGRVKWLGESERSIQEALDTAGEGSDTRTAVAEAGGWLLDYLTTQGGEADSQDIKAAGGKVGHSYDSLKRARRRVKVDSQSYGFPRKTRWFLPAESQSEQPSGSSPGETALTALTAPTAPIEAPVSAVGAVGAVSAPPARDAPTALLDCNCGALPGREHWEWCHAAVQEVSA